MNGSARLAVAMVVAVAVVVAGGPVTASEPAVSDPLDGATAPPSGADLAGSIRPLEPGIRRLEPRVRSLEPTVRDLQTEERDGTQTTVTISTDVLFAFDSAELTPPATRVISELATRVAASNSDVLVVGHTDGIGTRTYNQELSERRAAAVAEVLRDQLDQGHTITTEGRNFSEPVAPETIGGEDNPQGRARNRRVEIAFDQPS